MNAAIILAGGRSERLSGGAPKQFRSVCGKPLVAYSLEAFDVCNGIGAIVVVSPEKWREIIPAVDTHCIFAAPGETRQHSIYNALAKLEGFNCDLAVIHDAARPLVTPEDVNACLQAAEGYDGATPALEMTDTVYRSMDGSEISGLINRDELFAGQTPEVYNYRKYFLAHEGADLSRIRGSSELAVAADMRIRLYPGRRENIKITTESDWKYLFYLLESVK